MRKVEIWRQVQLGMQMMPVYFSSEYINSKSVKKNQYTNPHDPTALSEGY